MANDQEQMFNNMLTKLGMKENTHLVSKAKEISDLIATKNVNISKQLNDSAKIILCIDISCSILNITFNTEEGIKKSSLRKFRYEKQRQTLMKLLNFNKKLEINEIALKLEIMNPSVERTAKKILAACVERVNGVDLEHPQFKTMSIYQACKVENVKTAKKKFIAMSNLKPNEWSKLEKIFDECVSTEIKPDNGNKSGKKVLDIIEQANNESSQTLKRKADNTNEVEDYETWKKRTLEKAYADLRLKLIEAAASAQ